LTGAFAGGALGFARPEQLAAGEAFLEFAFPAANTCVFFQGPSAQARESAAKSSTLLNGPYDLRV